MRYHFFVEKSKLSVAKAAGIAGPGLAFEPCAMQVGDLLNFPEAPQLFWRVASRLCVGQRAPSTSEWRIFLESVEAPDWL